MKKLASALSLCALISQSFLHALPPETAAALTVPDLLVQVRAANPELRSARRRLDEAEAAAVTAAAPLNPRLEAELGSGGNEFKLAQPLPLTRRAGTAGAAARAGAGAAQKELEALETRVLSAARSAWYELRIAMERRVFEQSHLKSSMEILGKIELRLQTGEAGNADLARAKVEVARGRLHLQEAEAACGAAAGEANFLMGRAPDAPLEIALDGAFSLAPSPSGLEPLEHYTRRALAGRAEPGALALRARAAGLEAKLEKDRRIPVPEVGLIRGSDGGTGYSRLFLGLELPLWYNNKGEIRAALARRATLDDEATRLELEIRREVYSAWLELGLAQKRLSAARETVFLLNDLRRAASQAYLAGKTGLADFYETNRVFLEENISYLDALKDYYGKAARLDAAVNSVEEK